jgi:hypothetical protein
LTSEESVTALQWLELQRNCLLMYTSCGWFFDELSGIETVQVMAYAGRAIQLAAKLGRHDVEQRFLADLVLAKSNVSTLGTGADIYERSVRPMRVDLAKVAAHYAVTSLCDDHPSRESVFGYEVEAETFKAQQAPGHTARLVGGRVRVTSRLTREEALFACAAVHLGELDLRGGVRPSARPGDDAERAWRLEVAFAKHAFDEVIGILDAEFAARDFSLQAVFRDERGRLVTRLLAQHAHDLESAFRRAVAAHRDVMLLVHGFDTPLLPAFRQAVGFVINLDLRRTLDEAEPDPAVIGRLVAEAELWGHQPDGTLRHAAQGAVARAVAGLRDRPTDAAQVKRVTRLIELVETLGLKPDLWQAQNDFYDLLQSGYPSLPPESKTALAALGERLKVRVDAA